MPGQAIHHVKQASDIGPAMLRQIQGSVDVDEVAVTIKEMLRAELKNARGEFYPDWRAREAGAKLYLAYMVGMPVQRQVTMTPTSQTDEETLVRLLSSPASRRALKVALLGGEEGREIS